jgi:conjugative relaxase-like TrwC/TraI family protein
VIPFTSIAGVSARSTRSITNHLLNQTLSPEEARVAAYYALSQERDQPLLDLAAEVVAGRLGLSEAAEMAVLRYPVPPMAALPPATSDVHHWGREVAHGHAEFLDVLDMLTLGEFDRRPLEGRVAIESRVGDTLLKGIAEAEREMRGPSQAWYEERIGRLADRLRAGLDNAPLAVIRPDASPGVLRGLGIERDALLNAREISGLLAGRRADGEPIAGKRYIGRRQLPPNPVTGKPRTAVPIGAYDFVPTPDKSVSVAWGFAVAEERGRLVAAHLDAAREAMGLIAERIGAVRLGNGGSKGKEPGEVVWLEFTHHTARATDQPGDPDLHTHFLIPNAVFCASGRVGALDTMAIRGSMFEADMRYHARLAENLRGAGFEVEVDRETGVARMGGVPEEVREHFSKRHAEIEGQSRGEAEARGEVWGELSLRQRRLRRASHQRGKGGRDDRANPDSWRRQAKEVGWEAPSRLSRDGPERSTEVAAPGRDPKKDLADSLMERVKAGTRMLGQGFRQVTRLTSKAMDLAVEVRLEVQRTVALAHKIERWMGWSR